MTMNKALVAQIRDALEAYKVASHCIGSGTAENALRCLSTLVEDEKHCNYANYETFLVKLAIDNDRDRKAAALALASEHEGIELADALKVYVETWVYGAVGPDTLPEDLMGAAIGAVDWREIAGELAGEIAEGVE